MLKYMDVENSFIKSSIGYEQKDIVWKKDTIIAEYSLWEVGLEAYELIYKRLSNESYIELITSDYIIQRVVDSIEAIFIREKVVFKNGRSYFDFSPSWTLFEKFEFFMYLANSTSVFTHKIIISNLTYPIYILNKVEAIALGDNNFDETKKMFEALFICREQQKQSLRAKAKNKNEERKKCWEEYLLSEEHEYTKMTNEAAAYNIKDNFRLLLSVDNLARHIGKMKSQLLNQ